MRVIYNTCIQDPWALVARKLQDEYGFEPVYWIGYEQAFDNSGEVIPKMFPNIIFQPFWNAWKGIFPPEIAEKYAESFIDIDFLKKNALNELLTLKMMDRMDYDRYSFNCMERERHFINLVKHWTACIKLLKPDIVISAVLPHRVYDYVLYLLCKYYNIKYVCFQYSLCTERVFAVPDILSIGDIFDKDYKNLSGENIRKEDLPYEILSAYEKVKSDYSIAIPLYMGKHEELNKKASRITFLAKRYLKHPVSRGFMKKGINATYYKNRKYSVENTHFSMLEYTFKKKRTFRYNKFLKKYYASLTSQPDFNVPYIIFFPHYQPEATTSPGGDIFVNQRLCVETLLKYTPDEYSIYFKEHPNQFMSHMEGHTSRIKEFYDDLVRSPRVKLMPFEIDSYTLIRSAKAVSTVTGTVGWEAMVQQKPVIVFGIIWYERYSGVLRVFDEVSASGIKAFIENYKFNEQDLLAYLSALAKNTVRAYHYVDTKNQVQIKEEECIINLVKEVLRVAAI
jgi:SAM-dependent methyltransferase